MAEGMTESEILSVANAEFDSAMGAPGGEISIERAKAWDNYLSKELGNEVDGQSQVVTSDVSDVIDGIMPSLLRLFTTADNLVSFDPVGPEDIEQAEQESDYVNHVFFKQNPAFTILYNWFFDALIQKNGIIKAWWDDSEVITTETYNDLLEPELFQLLDDEELEPEERSSRIKQVPDPQTGEMTDQTVHDVTFKRVSKTGRPRVDNVPPEEYRISADSRSLDPSDARMVGQEREITRSDLIAMGFDKSQVMDLPAAGLSNEDSDEEIARYNKTDETQEGSNRDRSQDLIEVREVYMRLDKTGNGRSELFQIFIAGNELLSHEPVDRQPFHVISPQPLPHKHFGRATAEKVNDVQEVSTTLLRQMLDNLYHTNNPGHAVWEQGISENTLDDLLTTRVGRVARFNRPVSESYSPMTVPFTAGQSFPMLEFFDKIKRDRTGVNADSEGLSPEQLKNIQSSVLAQANDLSRMKIETIARIFAETGIKTLFLHIHELLQKHQDKETVVQLRNRWIPIDPSSWRTRFNMTVNIGLGIGSRESNLIHLNNIMEAQRTIIENGGMNLLVTPDNIFNTMAEMVKNANLKDPEMFFTDPQGQPAPPPTSEQEELARQQQAIQQRQQQLDAQENQIDQARLQLQHQREMAKITNDQAAKEREHLLEVQKMLNEKEHKDDQTMVELEKIANKLTELELNSGRDVPGSRI